MTGVGAAVGYVCAWLARRAGQAGGENIGADTPPGRLHDLLSRRLGADPVLERARAESGRGVVTECTRRWLVASVEAAADEDETFATELGRLVEQTQAEGTGTEVPAGDHVDFKFGEFEGPVLGKGTQHN
ncbi:MAG TPA: hypothetical protein VIU15_01390, partial [Streptomyces sp.]